MKKNIATKQVLNIVETGGIGIYNFPSILLLIKSTSLQNRDVLLCLNICFTYSAASNSRFSCNSF